MNRIDRTFTRLKRYRRKALIGYLTAGFPYKASLKRLVPLMEHAGLDLVELGIPFSDPVADGPTIQRASQIALAKGVNLDWVLRTVATLRNKGLRLPVVFMSYCNPIYRMGIDHFFSRARRSGVDGVIIPDLIPEEAVSFMKAARQKGIHLIYLVTPTTSLERMRRIARDTRGFLYVVSLTGVTGARRQLPIDLVNFLRKVRRISPRPIAVGFGLSTRQHVQTVAPHVDGVIVGSALISEIEQSKSNSFRRAASYVAALSRALNPTPHPNPLPLKRGEGIKAKRS